MTAVIVGLALIAFVAALVLAERSLRRQQGSRITRSDEERLAVSHIATNATRGAGGQGA